VVEENHLAARAPELVKQNGLVGEVTGQAIRRIDQQGGAGALADPVAQPIQGRSRRAPLKPLSTKMRSSVSRKSRSVAPRCKASNWLSMVWSFSCRSDDTRA
jgi:hypothetical protein